MLSPSEQYGNNAQARIENAAMLNRPTYFALLKRCELDTSAMRQCNAQYANNRNLFNQFALNIYNRRFIPFIIIKQIVGSVYNNQFRRFGVWFAGSVGTPVCDND